MKKIKIKKEIIAYNLQKLKAESVQVTLIKKIFNFAAKQN